MRRPGGWPRPPVLVLEDAGDLMLYSVPAPVGGRTHAAIEYARYTILTRGPDDSAQHREVMRPALMTPPVPAGARAFAVAPFCDTTVDDHFNI